MVKVSLSDNDGPFEATCFNAAKPRSIVLFAAGAGGNPERHLPLLMSLSEQGCTVIAPHFARIVSPRPTEQELRQRARRLRLALDAIERADLPVAGVGHSIGTTLLLALAGAQAWMDIGSPLLLERDARLSRLALMTPATDFFRAPGALDAVRTPMIVWAGTNDRITPSAQAQFLKETLGHRVPVDLRLVDGAGHFSFMNTLPPQMSDQFPGRDALLAELPLTIGRFVAAPLSEE